MKALLLLAFGGPRSLDEVESFLTRLFRGRKPSPEQLEKIKERYRLIGGSSPLPKITQRQARGLEESLNAKGYPFKSYVGMRYGHPLIEETLKEILRDGIREGLMEFTPEERERVRLIFTAHSLPKSMIEGDPYVKDMEASIRGVLEGMESRPWHMAFQSRGGGPEEWAGPDVESVLLELSGKAVHEILIVPIGFVSDHIEVLYDIDILYRKKAESLGMVLKRSPSINFSERFIEAISNAVEEHLRGFKVSWGQG